MIASPAYGSHRDIVVIGCSAGGVEALPRILQQLPGDLKAAIFIVQHMAPTGERYLVGILARTCELEVAFPETTDPLPHLGTFTCPGVQP